MISTLIVRYKLSFKNKESFNDWHNRMNEASKNAVGFLDRTELPPIKEEEFHSVVLRFDNKENAQIWMNSKIRKEIMQSEFVHVDNKVEMIYDNGDFWFTKNSIKPAIKWKQWIVTFLAVYPLTLIVPYIVNLIFEKLESKMKLIESILIGLIITGAMVYKVMPFMLNIFKSWLDKSK